VLRRNFLSGFGYCVNMSMTSTSTNLIFEDNIIATDIGWYWGPLYADFSALFRTAGSSWAKNKLLVRPGTVPRSGSNGRYTAADNGKFVHPGTYSLSDWR
jgi:hypothetical protein